MKKLITAVIAASFFAIAACSDFGLANVEGTAKVVTNRGTGSSFQIQSGVWLTAAHVIPEGATTVTLELNNGSKLTAVVKWVDRNKDVAYLVAPKDYKIRVIPLVCIVPEQRSAVIHEGYPYGFPYGVYLGVVATKPFKLDGADAWPELQIVAMTAGPGSSGGVVLQRGKAVGMVVAGLPNNPTFTAIITGKYLCDVIATKTELFLG